MSREITPIVWSHIDELKLRNPGPRARRIAPLSTFSGERLDRILDAIKSPERPDRMLRFELCKMPSRAWFEWHIQRGVDPDTKREKIPRRLRAAVIARDGRTCQICGGEISDGEVIHLDHIVALIRGGETTRENLRVTHSKCNLQKGAR